MVDTPLPASRLISQLLHDAQLAQVEWDHQLGSLSFTFLCLRRNVDGSEMPDTSVTLKLLNVGALAVGYESSSMTARPSEFNRPQRITAADLGQWRFRRQEAYLAINPASLDDALDSAVVDWMTGDARALQSTAVSWCITFGQWLDFGMPVLHIQILAGGESFSVESNGLPLDLQDWEAQYKAWWQGWRKHWATKSDQDEANGNEFEKAIPAGESTPPDLTYRPPNDPPFALEAHSVPPEVTEPLWVWFETHHKDWDAIVGAFANPAIGHEERAEKLSQWQTGHLFGGWGYARSVDSWWVEGRRACVVLRGIEHSMACEGDPARNTETLWTFVLRQRQGRWTIATYSLGWPDDSSAAAVAADRKSWLAKWKGGPVRLK